MQCAYTSNICLRKKSINTYLILELVIMHVIDWVRIIKQYVLPPSEKTYFGKELNISSLQNAINTFENVSYDFKTQTSHRTGMH